MSQNIQSTKQKAQDAYATTVENAVNAKDVASANGKAALRKANETSDKAMAKLDEGNFPPIVLKIEGLVHWFTQLGLGKIGSNSHPLHPALIHLPLSALTLSFSLDAFNLWGPRPNKLFDTIFGNLTYLTPATLHEYSYYLSGLGLILAVPAVTTGLAELYEMVRAQVVQKGWSETWREVKEGKQMKLVSILIHAGLMDVVLGITYSTWSARRNAVLTTPSALNTFHASNSQLGLATLGLALIGYASYMGGALVYKYGMAIQRQGSALEMKDD